MVADIDGQMVALDIEKGVCYGLNRVATRVWQLIETPSTAEAVCQTLLGEFDVDQATCLSQTLDLFKDLEEAGLIAPQVQTVGG